MKENDKRGASAGPKAAEDTCGEGDKRIGAESGRPHSIVSTACSAEDSEINARVEKMIANRRRMRP